MLTCPGLLNGGCRFPRGVTIKLFYDNFRGIVQENKYFYELNVNFYCLGSHSTCKVAVTFFAYGCTVSPPITYICLCGLLLMVNVKSHYLLYEVAVGQFCGLEFTGLNPVTSDFSVSCFYFDSN